MAEDSGNVLERILNAATAHGRGTLAVGRRGQFLLRELLAGIVGERLLWKPIGLAVGSLRLRLPPASERRLNFNAPAEVRIGW